MRCALQEIGDDSPKVSEAVKESISTVPQENNFTSVEGDKESSLSNTNSDSRFAILTFLDLEADGKWRILAIPVQCLNHINLALGVDMEGLQLLFPPPINKLKIDQCKGPRGSLPHYAYSAKSFAENNTTQSNVRRRCQNKIASRAAKLNELPRNSGSQSSLACGSDLFPDSSAAAVNSSDKFVSDSKEDKSLKKNSRKKTRKKVRQSKKQSSDSGSTEQEGLTEEYVCVSLNSDTCSSNDVDKEVGMMLYPTGPEPSSSDDRLPNGCERNGQNDGINVMEAPKSCNSYIEEVEMSQAITTSIVQNSSGESTMVDSMNQLQDKGLDLAVIDRETKDIKRDELCCLDDIPDSLVMDSVSVGSNSDASTTVHDTGKQSGKVSSRITSNSGDEYFLGQNALNGAHNNGEHNEGIRHGGQNWVSNDKRVKLKRSASKSSSFNKFGVGGVLHGRTGKENSHSVWQKVKKNGSDECDDDLKKVNTTSSELDSIVKKDPSVSVIGLPKTEDTKHSKSKAGRKSKGKIDLLSKKEHSSYSRKGSHINKSMVNDDAKDSVQQNDMSQTTSQENNQQGLATFSGLNSDTICPVDDGLETDKVEPATSELVHSAQFHLEESNPQKSVSNNSIADMSSENTDAQVISLTVPCENINQSDMSQEQSIVSCNHSGGDEVDRTEKEVSSADYNAQNQSSGSNTRWKWVPVKKDTGLTNSESISSSSPACLDPPHSENPNSERSVEPEGPSFSQNQDSSLNVSRICKDQICSEFSCLDEDENQMSGNQVAACTLTENRNKHEEANSMINECDNQHTLENDSYRIAQAVNDACRTRLACEAVHRATGAPIAEFETLLHFCSPVIGPSPSSPSCLTCSKDLSSCAALCRHEMPDLSLGCLWQWYEEHGSYGLEVRAHDFVNPTGLGGVGHFPFRAYFVPSLSAVQLFKNLKNQRVNGSSHFPDVKVSEACEMSDISEHSSTAGQHPIFSVHFPQPRIQETSIPPLTQTASIKNASNPSVNSACCDDPELLFEYFESEQPQQRWPLCEKIEELVRGDIPTHSQIYGDSTILDTINLQDLHPRSWYSVAWYPIYRIPEGNFRAAFLTYHSLGHLVRQSTISDFPTVGSCIVSPVVGLQSYNAQRECWFQLRNSALTAETMGLNPSTLLKERLRTLEETASLMSRSAVKKENLTCKTRHPDYEFFLSRRRY